MADKPGLYRLSELPDDVEVPADYKDPYRDGHDDSHLSQPVHWKGRQWAVTDHGLEGLGRFGWYRIARGAIWSDAPEWAEHMSEKTWVDAEDFAAALAVAKQRWPQKT